MRLSKRFQQYCCLAGSMVIRSIVYNRSNVFLHKQVHTLNNDGTAFAHIGSLIHVLTTFSSLVYPVVVVSAFSPTLRRRWFTRGPPITATSSGSSSVTGTTEYVNKFQSHCNRKTSFNNSKYVEHSFSKLNKHIVKLHLFHKQMLMDINLLL